MPLTMIDRRYFLVGSGAALFGCSAVATTSSRRAEFELIEATLGPGGRLGIAALNTSTGQVLTHRPNERFALCSTFKVALAAAWLARVDQGVSSLSDLIPFSAADLTDYAPIIGANLRVGRLPIEQLCAAIVEVSDNAAANLLLRPIGGPAGLTAIFREWGDRVSRLDRYEEQLGTNLPGDLRDTTSPVAMLGLMRLLLMGEALTRDSRARLIGWMEGAKTGLQRLRSGVPRSWRVGDKTGNGGNGAANDLAIAWPPRASPILIASYMSGGTAERFERDAGHAAVARAVVQEFGY